MIASTTADYDFDVALSYAGEDRSYVEQVAALLRERGVQVFYDQYMEDELWGSDLYVILDEVYRKRARFTIAFVSQHYVSKPWTRRERQSAQARALVEPGAYFLPVRLDDSDLPGLLPTTGYVDARHTTAERLVEMIERRVRDAPGTAARTTPVLRVPRTAEQQRELLARRPPGWEYLLFAGVLWQRKEALEPEWRDHELGYARRTGNHLDDHEAATFLVNTLGDTRVHARTLERVFDSAVQERAFGSPGEPGDPARIEHMAKRIAGVYEDILSDAATIRGTGVSEDLETLLELAARLSDRPLNDFRAFIDTVVTESDGIPDKLQAGDPVEMDFVLKLSVGDEALAAFKAEATRARRRLRR